MLSKIDEFVSLIEDSDGFSADSGAKFRDNLDLFSEETCPYLENVEVPKVLGDLLESLAGSCGL